MDDEYSQIVSDWQAHFESEVDHLVKLGVIRNDAYCTVRRHYAPSAYFIGDITEVVSSGMKITIEAGTVQTIVDVITHTYQPFALQFRASLKDAKLG